MKGIKFDGLDAFKYELQLLAANLTEEAGAIMVEHAEAAAADIRAAYPRRTGALRDGVTVTPARGILLAGAEVKNVARHAHLYEHGTVARHTELGANRGSMPADPTFIPIAASYRRSAISAVMFRLYLHGATRVTGDADAA